MGNLMPLNIFLKQEVKRMEIIIYMVNFTFILTMIIFNNLVSQGPLCDSMYCIHSYTSLYIPTIPIHSYTFLQFLYIPIQVKNTLSDLKLAVEGTIIMSEQLRDAIDCIFDARIPNAWKKV